MGGGGGGGGGVGGGGGGRGGGALHLSFFRYSSPQAFESNHNID